MTARVESLQIGPVGVLRWRGNDVRSAIAKAPVDGRVALRPDGLDGDTVADRINHGGPDKAVCCYPVEHRAYWEGVLGTTLPHGAFGENLSTAGLLERDVRIGDVLGVGSAVVQVSQPRGPCFKLAARWGRRNLQALMARSGISGFYLRVVQEGDVAAGDAIDLLDAAPAGAATVADVMRVTYVDRRDDALLERVLGTHALAAQWRSALAA